MDFSPQQQEFLNNYCNPKSDTFGNALQSALKAGYAQNYAESITSFNPEWLQKGLGKYGNEKMLNKAEKVLEETLDIEVQNHVKVGDEVVIKTDPALLKIKQDTAKFIAERLGKDKYSLRNELTGKDGKDLKITFDEAFKE